MKTIDFYYDIVCPYAYLASTRIAALAKDTGANLSYQPILLGGVLKSIGSPIIPMDTMPVSKARHNMQDMNRWADLWGVELTLPLEHPRRSVHVMRCVLAAGDAFVEQTLCNTYRVGPDVVAIIDIAVNAKGVVDLNAMPDRPAEYFVDGHLERLTLDVPQSYIDG